MAKAKQRMFALIDQGIAMEIVPPLPLDGGWKEIMPEDGDARKLYGFPMDKWLEITDLSPRPKVNWIYKDGVLYDPELLEQDS